LKRVLEQSKDEQEQKAAKELLAEMQDHWGWKSISYSIYTLILNIMPCGKKRKRHKISTHKRKKRLRKNRHKKK
jgi:hypothetical protein